MRYLLTCIAASTAALAGCAGNDMAGTAAGADARTPTDRAGFVTMAGASDLYEIQSSQLAQTKSSRTDVRQFAQMMVQHHTMTTQQVTAAARASGMSPPPPMLMPMQRDMIAQLQAAAPANFDRVYLDQQLTAHRMALALHTNYAERGDTPQLRTAAAGAVPIVQRHLDQVAVLQRTD